MHIYNYAYLKVACAHTGEESAGQFTLIAVMGPALVKLMPSEYCFNLLDTITLVHSVHFKRFLKVMQFICSILSLNLFAVKKPFNNLVKVFLNLALLQLKLDIWTAKAVIIPLKIDCYWIYLQV